MYLRFQLEDDQLELVFNLSLKEPGKYIVVIGYTSPLNKIQPVTVTMIPEGGNSTMGKAMLYECQYRYVCITLTVIITRIKYQMESTVKRSVISNIYAILVVHLQSLTSVTGCLGN